MRATDTCADELLKFDQIYRRPDSCSDEFPVLCWIYGRPSRRCPSTLSCGGLISGPQAYRNQPATSFPRHLKATMSAASSSFGALSDIQGPTKSKQIIHIRETIVREKEIQHRGGTLSATGRSFNIHIAVFTVGYFIYIRFFHFCYFEEDNRRGRWE